MLVAVTLAWGTAPAVMLPPVAAAVRPTATTEPVLEEIPLSGVEAAAVATLPDDTSGFVPEESAAPDLQARRGVASQEPGLATEDGAADDQATDDQATAGASSLSAPDVTAPDVLTAELDTRDFSVLGFTWDPGPADVTVAFRVRESGQWSHWQAVAGGDVAPDAGSLDDRGGERGGTDPIVAVGADGLQVWADSAQGEVTGLRAVLVDPGQRPDDTAAAVAAATVPVPGQPAIVERAAWGADESLKTCQPDYAPSMRAIAVHHTASANAYSADEVPGLLRGFYAYHVQSRGWCDIGYNFLVDRFGRVFEGRAGGLASTVVGVHTGGFNSRTVGVAAIGDYGTTGVPGALTDGLVAIIAWKASVHGIAADQPVTLVSGGGASRFPEGTVVTFPAVYGHRDAAQTSCPGQNLYDLLPTLRQRVAALANASVAAAPVANWEQLDTTASSLTVSGWALVRDDPTPLTLVVRVDGRPTTVTADRDRPDIGAAYPAAGGRHGFAVTLEQTPGRHVVCIEVVRPGGTGIVQLGCRTATVVNRAPVGAVDVLQVTGRTLRVAGWTFDPDTRDSTSVHVYIGSRGAVVPAELPRPDIAAAFGRGEKHGFDYTATLPDGRSDVCIYGIDSAGGAPTTLRCTTVQVGAPPIGVLEAVAVSGNELRVSGWAFDPDDAGPGSVHVYVDGQGVALAADSRREDVGAAYQRDARVGFSTTRVVGPGRHTVCAWAIDSGAAPPAALGCRDVVVRDDAPIGVIDAVSVQGRSVTVSGWAFDPDSSGPTSVHVYFAGTGVAAAADLTRSDVGAIYRRDARVGYSVTGEMPLGASQVCVYAINTSGPPHPTLGCRDVVVRDRPPVGVLESARVQVGSGGPYYIVSGWAFDPDSPGPTNVHVYIAGRGFSVAANLPRADVAAAYGRADARAGFVLGWVGTPPPSEVCVYAINTGGAPHPSLGCRTVTW